MKKIVLDTNAILRLLLNDIPAQVAKVEALLESAKSGFVTILIPEIVIFEIEFILLKIYRLPKAIVVTKINSVISTEFLEVESKNVFSSALAVYKESSNSFVDCFLVCKAKSENAELFTFDKKLKKIM